MSIHVLLTSALVGGEWSASSPDHFTPRKELPVPIWIGGGYAIERDLEKRKILPLPQLELRPFGRPARSQSLYTNYATAGSTASLRFFLYREKCLLDC
jgi:hypothetical protein